MGARHETVMVVEDDAGLRLLLEKELVDLGYGVRAFPCAEDALAHLEIEDDAAVVVSDIMMPGVDGVELTRRVKSLRPDTEVILVTAHASVGTAAEAVRLGAADYLLKPFDVDGELAASLARVLERRSVRLSERARVRTRELERVFLEGVVDALPLGVVLVDDEGKVLLKNGVAASLLEEEDGLAVDEAGRVVATRTEDAAALRALVRSDRWEEDCRELGRDGAMTIRRSADRSDISVLVTPLPGAARGGGNGPRAALFLNDPERRTRPAEDVLVSLYGLTKAEATVTSVLMQGRSVEETARVLKISAWTVRSHLKVVFQKTSVTRQGDLISLLLSGPALLRLGGAARS